MWLRPLRLPPPPLCLPNSGDERRGAPAARRQRRSCRGLPHRPMSPAPHVGRATRTSCERHGANLDTRRLFGRSEFDNPSAHARQRRRGSDRYVVFGSGSQDIATRLPRPTSMARSGFPAHGARPDSTLCRAEEGHDRVFELGSRWCTTKATVSVKQKQRRCTADAPGHRKRAFITLALVVLWPRDLVPL